VDTTVALDSSGRGTLRIPTNDVLAAQAARNGGVLNTEVVVNGTGESGTVATSRLYATSTAMSALAASGDPSVARYTGPVGVTTSATTTKKDDASTATPSAVAPCARVLMGTVLDNPTHLLNSYTDTHVTSEVQYGATADSDVSVAVSATGSTTAGSWSLSGTDHIGNVQGQAATTTHSGYSASKINIRTNQAKYNYSAGCFTKPYQVHTTAWDGSLYTAGPQTPNVQCASYPHSTFDPGGTYHKFTGRNNEYTAAVSAFGASLSATSGWSHQVDLRFSFDAVSGWNFWLCSHNGLTLPDGATVFAQAISPS
jgi:hypothetical protein